MVKEENPSKAMSLKTLTKSTVWDVQENDIFRMLEAAEKDAEVKDNLRHFADIIRSAFLIEELKEDSPLMQEKFQKMGYKELMRQIGDLPPDARTVFNMYVIEGYSHKEIAQALGITETTSRSQLQRARMMLQKMIKTK